MLLSYSIILLLLSHFSRVQLCATPETVAHQASLSIFQVRILKWVQFSSVQALSYVSLQPHGLQHARPPCPSPIPDSIQTHVYRVSDAIQSSHPLLSPSPPALNLSQHQGLFQ